MKEVVISTSKLNSYGFRVLTEGIDINQYSRNPVLLWGHHRTWRGTTDEVLPIGRVENLRVDGDRLIGTPVFDEQDEFAKKIKAKFESGFLKAVSAGLDIVELSDDASVIVQGQRRSTVTRSRLNEVSIVDIPANDDALTLYHEGKTVNLAAGDELSAAIPELNFKKDLNIISKMKTIALKLGLSETASEAEILTKIGELQASAGQTAELQTKLDAQRKAEINAEVETAIKQKRITADLREHFRTLGDTSGVESLRKTLEAVAPATKPTDIVGKGGKPAPTGEYKTLGEVPDDERVRLKAEEPEMYAKLYKAEYGVELKIKN
jgi:hypothetical protein